MGAGSREAFVRCAVSVSKALLWAGIALMAGWFVFAVALVFWGDMEMARDDACAEVLFHAFRGYGGFIPPETHEAFEGCADER